MQAWVVRRPCALLRIDEQVSAELEPDDAVGTDGWLCDLPLELTYRTAHDPGSVHATPEPAETTVALLLGAYLLMEAGDTLGAHDDSRGVFVFDRGALEELATGSSYEEAVGALESTPGAGLWIPKPTSATACVSAIEASLDDDERARAAEARARYPEQYRKDEGWLWDLRSIYQDVLRQRDQRATAR